MRRPLPSPYRLSPLPAAVAAALLGCLSTLPAAQAQEAAPAPTLAQADAAAVQTGQFEEIVITAQKRKEKLSDTPVAASVVAGDALVKANISDVADLNNLVPSVNLNGTFNGRVPMGMRGMSSVSNEATVGLASGVAIMIDGVPVPSDSRDGNVLEDVQSVEVLKGPQATLGGRTAAIGVINIVTRKPSSTFGGSVDATLTSDHEYRLGAFLTGPISEKLDYSISAYDDRKEFPIKNTELDRYSSEHTSGVRAKLAFAPTNDLDITLAVRDAVDDSTGANFVYTYLTPGEYLLTGAGGPPFMSQAALLPNITPSLTNLNYASPINGQSDVRDNDAVLAVDYRLGELTLGSTTAFLGEHTENYQDLFAVAGYFWNELTAGSGAPPFYNVQTQYINTRQISEELKLASPTDRPFSYLIGAFFSNTIVDFRYERDLLPALINEYIESGTKTTDLYGRAAWKLRSDTTLNAGLRFNSDSIRYSDNQYAYDASFPPPVIYSNLNASGSHSATALVGDLGLQHELSGDTMVYANYARGYSPSAYNTSADLTPATPTLGYVPKENIDHFELGSKGAYLNRSVTANLALFDTIYRNFQVQIFDPSNTSISPPLILTPAGKAETRGLEVDLGYAPSKTTRFNFDAALIDAKFDDYKGAPCWYGEPYNGSGNHCTQDLSGKTLPNAPKVKVTLGADHRVPLEAIPADLVMGGTYTYRGSVQMLVDQNPQAIQPGLNLLNLDLGLKSRSGNTSATLFVNNVFNKVYYVDMEDFWSGPWGNTNTVIGQPARDAKRYAGIHFQWKFN